MLDTSSCGLLARLDIFISSELKCLQGLVGLKPANSLCFFGRSGFLSTNVDFKKFLNQTPAKAKENVEFDVQKRFLHFMP